MKAIVENNVVIKRLISLPNKYTFGEFTYHNLKKMSSSELQAIGIYDVIIPDYDPTLYQQGDLVYDIDNDIVNMTIAEKILPTIEDAKLTKLEELENHLFRELSKTDWMIINELETGKKAKDNNRENLRSKYDELELVISGLTTVKEVLEYEIIIDPELPLQPSNNSTSNANKKVNKLETVLKTKGIAIPVEDEWEYPEYSLRIIAPTSLVIAQSSFAVWFNINGLPVIRKGNILYCYCNEILPEHQTTIDVLGGVITIENRD